MVEDLRKEKVLDSFYGFMPIVGPMYLAGRLLGRMVNKWRGKKGRGEEKSVSISGASASDYVKYGNDFLGDAYRQRDAFLADTNRQRNDFLKYVKGARKNSLESMQSERDSFLVGTEKVRNDFLADAYRQRDNFFASCA